MLVFDDSFEHEVIHESEGQRIVLIIDFHHPDMSQVNTLSFLSRAPNNSDLQGILNPQSLIVSSSNNLK